MASRSSKRRSSKRRSSPRVTRSTSRTIIKSAGSSSAVWMGALALAGVAVVGTAVYFTEKKANAAPSPGVLPPAPNPNPAPGPTPSQLPATGDVFSSLSAAQQAAVQAALYAYVVQGYGGCPQVLPNGMTDIQSNGITSPASLANAGNRSITVDCYQTALAINPPSLGVLDLATYRSLMGV